MLGGSSLSAPVASNSVLDEVAVPLSQDALSASLDLGSAVPEVAGQDVDIVDEFINWDEAAPPAGAVDESIGLSSPLHAANGVLDDPSLDTVALQAQNASLQAELAVLLTLLETKDAEMSRVVMELHTARQELDMFKSQVGLSSNAFASTSALPLSVAPAQLVDPAVQLRIQLDESQRRIVQLEETVEEQRSTISSLRADVERITGLFRSANDNMATLRAENNALRHENKVVKSQATHGVAQARILGEAQAKELEDQLKRSEIVCELLQQQNRLTGDGVRAKAAEHPKLLKRIEDLQDQIGGQRRQIDDIGQRNRALQDELFDERQRAKDNAHTVYRCSWFVSEKRCGETFASTNALTDHVASHLVGYETTSQRPEAMDTSV